MTLHWLLLTATVACGAFELGRTFDRAASVIADAFDDDVWSDDE